MPLTIDKDPSETIEILGKKRQEIIEFAFCKLVSNVIIINCLFKNG